MTSMDLTRLCQFCGRGQKISDCVCEAGLLLRAVFRMTSGSSTESILKEVTDLYEVVEESAKKRQKTRATTEGQATGSEGSGGSRNVTFPTQSVEGSGSRNVIPPPPPPPKPPRVKAPPPTLPEETKSQSFAGSAKPRLKLGKRHLHHHHQRMSQE